MNLLDIIHKQIHWKEPLQNNLLWLTMTVRTLYPNNNQNVLWEIYKDNKLANKYVKWYVSAKKPLLFQIIFEKCKISRVCKVVFAIIRTEWSLDMAGKHKNKMFKTTN